MKDTSATCNVVSTTVKQSKIQYNAINPGSSPCAGSLKATAASTQQAYKQALNKWSDSINTAGDVCTVGHGLWMYNAEMDNTHFAAMKEITEDLSELCASDEEFDVENAIEEAKKDLESDELARLDSGRQSLEAALHQVAEALYKAEAPPAGEGPAGEEAGPDSNDDEDVIDAEYTEEKTDS